ncbi:SHOCT domain-containing protein [Phytoactinopolyspora endophytica]|uniref:SHOCT domain-containing protein n=1 Tax=Phytoactinopolyspora endophytica TaxID=1642495 RepID=UPI00101C6889|nr:SHOCT domain-containing protein [Phytoactinopolyspora endophytica]
MDDYPLLNLFFTMIWFFLFVAWIWLLISVVADVFRSSDLSGWAKALWTLLVVVVPVLGALVYLIARGEGMTTRMLESYGSAEQRLGPYRPSSYGAGMSTADELTKLAQLRESGAITDAEFESQKAKLLA